MANFGDTFGKGQAVSLIFEITFSFCRDVEDSMILSMVTRILIALETMIYQQYFRKAWKVRYKESNKIKHKNRDKSRIRERENQIHLWEDTHL